MAKECPPDIIDLTLTAATIVHRNLGPGLLESVYEAALAYELRSVGIAVRTQVAFPVMYRGVDLGIGFRADMIVAESLILEIKSLRAVDASHVSQLLTYLRLGDMRIGFILNFNHRLLKDGIKRVSLFSSPRDPRVPRGNFS
ncbi:MAG TPA: GxxExxY protein [Povalibacter sp.]|uniref:GxxExxY protein n=1 Tax=Povalibacter sp. TaxID=1962978 RepID=UPI002C65F06D|nr:GxxExxY protein [Povalibacter sp.]HMN43503.1 GxxExxY protein [Povalibacter sp.]